MRLLLWNSPSQTVEAVWDGEDIWVLVRRICENLGITPHRQIQKIKQDPTFDNLRTLMLLQLPSGSKEAFCLHVDALSLWLGSVSPAKVGDDAKEGFEMKKHNSQEKSRRKRALQGALNELLSLSADELTREMERVKDAPFVLAMQELFVASEDSLYEHLCDADSMYLAGSRTLLRLHAHDMVALDSQQDLGECEDINTSTPLAA